MGLTRLSVIAVAAFASLLYFLFAPIERRTISSDGRIVIDANFIRNGSFPPRIFALADAILGLLPGSMLSLKKDDLKRSAQWWCGPGEFWKHPYGEEALTALTDAIEMDKPPLTNVGRMMLRENFVSWLCTQVRVNELLTSNPEIGKEPVSALVIAGSPRTGSTHLLSMLCQHPNATCLTFAESITPLSPVPRGDWVLTWRDVRYWRSMAAAGIVLTLRPLFSSMFKFGPKVPMEELQLGAVGFGSSLFLTQMYLPSYDEWFKRTDHTPVEEYIKTLLQVIQFQRRLALPDAERKMWILKSPQNADQLGPKTRTFPESKLVFMHREAVPVMQSLIGMIAYTVGIFNHVDKVDYEALIELWLEHQRWSLVERLSAAEVAIHVHPRDKLMNVRFKDFMTDPVSMVLHIAQHAGLSNTKEARDAFERFQRESPREGSNVLKYDTRSFGITEEDIAKQFRPYEKAYL